MSRDGVSASAKYDIPQRRRDAKIHVLVLVVVVHVPALHPLEVRRCPREVVAVVEVVMHRVIHHVEEGATGEHGLQQGMLRRR